MTNPAGVSGAFDAIMLGGGMAGLTLAIALDQAGLSVAVIDKERPETGLAPNFDGRASAIAFASFRMWEALGIAAALDGAVQPIEQILVTDGRLGGGLRIGGPSPLALHFSNQELPGREGGPLGYMVENRRTRAALEKRLKSAERVTRFAPDALAALDVSLGGVRARLQSGVELRAPIILGLDGRSSELRTRLKIRTHGWDYGQTAIVTTVRHEKPHQGTAHELFLPAGPFAILPLTENRANIVWVEKTRAAEALLAMDDQDFELEFERRFGDFLGETSLVSPRFSYPLRFQAAERIIADRAALAGDSAHGVHPIAGQGLNMGLRDVAALAETLSDAARLGLDLGALSTLDRYERWRRFDNAALAFATDGFNRLFSNDVGPIRAVRDLGLAIVDRIGPARRFFMQAAGGGVGDLPKLLRGEALA